MALVPKMLKIYSSAPLCRSLHSSSVMHDTAFKKLMFKLNGIYKYGILQDDLLSVYDKDCAEAIRRLPEEEKMKRLHRAIRAQEAEIKQSILPEDQWTKFEDDHHYLHPYLKEVVAERLEREEWNSKY